MRLLWFFGLVVLLISSSALVAAVSNNTRSGTLTLAERFITASRTLPPTRSKTQSLVLTKTQSPTMPLIPTQTVVPPPPTLTVQKVQTPTVVYKSHTLSRTINQTTDSVTDTPLNTSAPTPTPNATGDIIIQPVMEKEGTAAAIGVGVALLLFFCFAAAIHYAAANRRPSSGHLQDAEMEDGGRYQHQQPVASQNQPPTGLPPLPTSGSGPVTSSDSALENRHETTDGASTTEQQQPTLAGLPPNQALAQAVTQAATQDGQPPARYYGNRAPTPVQGQNPASESQQRSQSVWSNPDIDPMLDAQIRQDLEQTHT